MTGRIVAIAAFGLTTALYVTGVVLTLLAGERLSLNELLIPAVYAFSVVGFLIALNRPGNAVAWVCLAVGFTWSLEAGLWGAAFYGLAHPGPIPYPQALAAVGAWLWIPGIFGMAAFVLMLFPDGRLPSRRWRWLPWLAGTSVSLGYVRAVLLEPDTFSYGRPVVESPFPVILGADVDGAVPDVVVGLLDVSMIAAVIASVAALVLRYRRSTGMERQQLKWLATAGTAAIVLFGVAVPLVDVFGQAVALVAALFFALIPVSIGVAVLRYRLYEIDRLVSRTVTYALVVGALVAVYAGGVLLVGSLLPRQSDVAVAASTLTVAALFNPLRRRVQDRVDRRFNRARYDAARLVEGFRAQLRDEVDLDALHRELVQAAANAMQPSGVSLWLRDK